MDWLVRADSLHIQGPKVTVTWEIRSEKAISWCTPERRRHVFRSRRGSKPSTAAHISVGRVTVPGILCEPRCDAASGVGVEYAEGELDPMCVREGPGRVRGYEGKGKRYLNDVDKDAAARMV